MLSAAALETVGCEVRPHIHLQCVLAKLPVSSFFKHCQLTKILCSCMDLVTTTQSASRDVCYSWLDAH